ncbi:MAG: hypothetical protein H0V40_05265, partial [Actinobacteria bacterium]|nr:hypothetical protein [Actinomycetota bacterium]
MKKVLLIVAALGMLAFAAPALAQPGQTEVCPSYDGKYELDGGWEGAAAPGITIAAASDEEVIVTVADGFTLSQFCYKTGQGGGGATSREAPIVGPASFSITKTVAGGGISHITFDTNATPQQESDVCPNIEGAQASVPAGMTKNEAGECIANEQQATDVCPNIEGAQASVPGGMTKNEAGECVAQTTVVTVTVPGPERIVEVAGPERVVERIVTVPGPERVVERIVTVEKPAVAGATSSVVTRVVTKTKI